MGKIKHLAESDDQEVVREVQVWVDLRIISNDLFSKINYS